MHRIQAGLALIPVALTILWLPLAGGGTDSSPLRLVEILTFIAVAVLVLLRATLIVAEDRKLLLALGIVLLGATISTIFSADPTKSIPHLIEWLWLASVAILTLYLIRAGLSSALVGMLLLALSAQVFWAYLLWVVKGDPSALHFGTFYAPNQYAGFILMLTPILVGLALRARGPMLVTMGTLSAAALASIVLSGSRGGAVAGLFALVAVGLLYRRRKQWIRLAITVSASGVIVWGAVTALGASAKAPSDSTIGPGISQKFADNPQSLQMRLRWAKGAVLIGASHPLTGSGLGTFGDEFLEIQHQDWQWSAFAHNQYLEAFAEGGSLLFLGMVLIPLVALRRRIGWPDAQSEEFGWRAGSWAGLFGASLHLLIDHDWSYPAFAAAFLIIAVLNVGVRRKEQWPNLETKRPPGTGGLFVWILNLTTAR